MDVNALTHTEASSMEPGSSENLERGQAALEAFGAMQKQLSLVNASTIFHQKDLSKLGEGVVNRNPAALKAEVEAQISHLRKVKVQYVIHSAKDKYIKTVMDDDPQLITPEMNEELQRSMEKKKATLKEAKEELSQRQEAVRTLAPLVEEDFKKAQAMHDEVSNLTQKILEARLALTRLRSAHGAPGTRMTVPSAEAILEKLDSEVHTLGEEQDHIEKEMEAGKNKMKAGMKEVEGLKAERAALEREVAARVPKEGEETEEGRDVAGLYEWFSASLGFHRSLFGLESFEMPTENSIHLQYHVKPSIAPAANTVRTKTKHPRDVAITLLFLPNTRRLADVRVVDVTGITAAGNITEGKPLELGDIVDAYVQANDVPRLVAGVLAMVRSGVV